jgi:hypothetical protein
MYGGSTLPEPAVPVVGGTGSTEPAPAVPELIGGVAVPVGSVEPEPPVPVPAAGLARRGLPVHHLARAGDER